ncbi:MAG: SPOR domain-containing protein [Bacteroidales bacterium]|nr:SPOR domain-containing protein [Candidatus Cacconaster merdequi]
MKTEKIILLLTMLSLATVSLAQNPVEHVVVDTSSTAIPHIALIDSSYCNVYIMDLLNSDFGGEVTVNQSAAIEKALRNQIAENSSRKIKGYRVRIFFDNGKNARNQSAYIADSFAQEYPQHRVYRSHVSPYFNVTVGDFRTKKDAQLFANSIIGRYPSVFLVKEDINYPDN